VNNPTTTPADTLRAAAKRLRKLAGQATPAPWETTWRGQEYQLDGNTENDLSPISQWTYAIATWEPQASEQRAECDVADADYMAAMHPGVGAALADWLDAEAARLDATALPFWQETVGRHALAVARQLLGEGVQR
jgi:hypothetical protein